MKKSHDAWVAQNAAAKTAAEARRNTENAADTTTKQQYEAQLQTLDAAGFNAGNIDQKRTDLQNAKTDAEQKQTAFNQAQKQHDDAQGLIDQDNKYTADLTNLQKDNTKLNNTIATIDALLSDPQTFANMPEPKANALANNLMMKRMQAEQKIQQNDDEIQQITQERALIPAADLAHARQHIAQYQTDMQNAQNIYNAAQSNVDDLNTKIEDFDNATARIKELDERIKKRDDTVNNWDKDHQDKYQELMAYWDLLETGRDSHTGPMYSWALGNAKKKQDKFDKNKNVIFATYSNKYSMAA